MDNNAGILSVVGTPIGNLEDVSGRAVDTLERADAILCEKSFYRFRNLPPSVCRR